MQATTQQIGYLTSIPNFATMLVLLWTPLLSERARSRKAFIIPIDLFLCLLWLPILAIPFLFHTNQLWWLIIFVTLSTVAGNIIGAPWSAMMADRRRFAAVISDCATALETLSRSCFLLSPEGFYKYLPAIPGLLSCLFLQGRWSAD
jgi:MFS family permease